MSWGWILATDSELSPPVYFRHLCIVSLCFWVETRRFNKTVESARSDWFLVERTRHGQRVHRSTDARSEHGQEYSSLCANNMCWISRLHFPGEEVFFIKGRIVGRCSARLNSLCEMSGERAILTKRITASIESWMNFKLWMKFMWNFFEHDIVLVVNFVHNSGEKAIFTCILLPPSSFEWSFVDAVSLESKI